MRSMHSIILALLVVMGLSISSSKAAWVDATVYTFEGQGADSLKNSGPVGGDLSLIGAPVLVASPQGQAYQFTATSSPLASQGLEATPFANPDYKDGFRVEVSFKADSAQVNDHARLVDHGDWYISMLPGGQLRFGGILGGPGAGDTARNVGSNLADGQWHTVVMIYDPSVGGTYGRLTATVDGVATNSFDLIHTAAPDFSTAKSFRIGTLHSTTTSNRAFNGMIDYVKVQVVPEPAAMGLLGIAATSMLVRLRSR